MTDSEAANLRRRDVMLELASPADRLPNSVSGATREWLADELLPKLRGGVSSRTMGNLLDAKVLA